MTTLSGRRSFMRTSAGAAAAALVSRYAWTQSGIKLPLDDVVVVIPGLMGSILTKAGKEIWNPSPKWMFRVGLSRGGSLKDLQLDGDSPKAETLDDGVTAVGLVNDVHAIPGLWRIDGYTKIRREIANRFAAVENQNLFSFPYDWRRDNRAAARRLKRQAETWLGAWRQTHPAAKLVLVVHSMGGVVARYFLECLEGWRDTRKLVSFGTPYAGSVHALNYLSNGYHKELGPFTVELTSIARSFTSLYQLLPTYKCFGSGTELQRLTEVSGVPGVSDSRVSEAAAFHREIEQAVNRHLKDDDYIKNRYLVHPVVGRRQLTPQTATLSGDKVVPSNSYLDDARMDGDGTVSRISATPAEILKQEREFYIAEKHASLQNNDAVLNQLEGLLTAAPISQYLGPGALEISLDIEEAYGVKERIVVRARHEPATLKISLRLRAESVETGATVTHQMRVMGEGRHEMDLGRLAAGVYRLTAYKGTDSVTDVVIVA